MAYRCLGVILTIFGLYLLFSPIIAFLEFIPFVGYMLGSLASFAAFLFALIVGLTVSSLTIAFAWVFYRPLVGIPLLMLAACGIYLILIHDPNGG